MAFDKRAAGTLQYLCQLVGHISSAKGIVMARLGLVLVGLAFGVLIQPFAAAEEPRNAKDGTRVNSATVDLLKDAGYVAVPMRHSENTGFYYIDGMYYGNKLTFLIDTGCNGLCLTELKAKALAWPARDNGSTGRGFGGTKTVKAAIV